MRAVRMLVVVFAGLFIGTSAYAGEYGETEIPFDFRLSSADGQTASAGLMMMNWDGCGGDLFAFVGGRPEKAASSLGIIASMHPSEGGMGFPAAGMPVGTEAVVAFWAGAADLGLLDDKYYQLLFCNPCDVSCCPVECCGVCDEDCFYLYETSLCLPDGVVHARAWLPCGMKLVLAEAGELGVSFPFTN